MRYRRKLAARSRAARRSYGLRGGGFLSAAPAGALLLAMTGGEAFAQSEGVTTSTSYTHGITFTPITAQVRVDTFSTEIIGRLNGGTIFDQTFNAAFGSST